MNLRAHVVGRVGLLGAAGGAVNAWWCYAKFPVSISDGSGGFFIDTPSPIDFPAWIVPAGAAHGLLLAVIPIMAAHRMARASLLSRMAAAPLVGWTAGAVSWVPLNLVVGVGWWSYYAVNRDIAVWPFSHFGLVALLLYASLVMWQTRLRGSIGTALLAGCLSGFLGSLWWWMRWGRWWFSLLHGAVWGSFVGYGLWRTQRTDAPTTES